MPTYVYKCAECGHVFEARQRMTEDPLTDCPRCERKAIRRVINSVGVVFKGNGFYVTDNRNGKSSAISSNGNGSATKEPAPEGSAANESATAKSETKEEPSSSATEKA